MEKYKLLRILFILQIILIFSFSLMNGPDSSETSGSLTELILSLLPLDISFDAFHLFVRKCAHFTEYAVLGGLAVLNALHKPFFSSFKGTVLVPWITVPLLDEGLQRLVPERAGMFSDCLIDMCGYLTAVLIILYISGRRTRRRQSLHIPEA